jgi:hypothetical protein
MARKYRKLGLRRDRNLADIENKYSALANLLNGLAAPGETFLPEDIFVINNLRNTNVTKDDFAQIKGLKLTYLDGENTERTLTPIVRLEDRIENYKVATGSPPYLTGGDGLNATFIPSSNIKKNITIDDTGSTIFTTDTFPNYGPFLFWDNGSFEFQNLIYPDFQDSYGMIQWEGFFAPEPDDQRLTINYFTTGLLLIEQDPFDDGSWETLKFIYNKERSIVVESEQPQTQITTIAVGDNIKYLNIGDKIKNQDIYIVNINSTNNTIQLDTPVDLAAGNNTFTFEFGIGQDELQGFFRVRSSFLNDKVKIRITAWWPDPEDLSVFYGKKTLSFFYPNVIVLGSRDVLSYNFLYTNFNRQYEPEKLSVEYFFNNYLSSVNETTKFSISINSNVLLKYNPPLLPNDRFDNTALRTFTYAGIGKIERPNSFSDVVAGDFIIRTSSYTKTYLIKEKKTNNEIFINLDNDIAPFTGNTFDGFIVKNSGFVGAYNINNLKLSPLVDNDFSISLVNENQLIATIDTNNVITGFFRITTYNFETGDLILETVSNTGQTPADTGTAVVYRSSALEDLSKINYCKGVLAKEVDAIATENSSKIYLKNTNGLYNGMYAQLLGFIAPETTITVGTDTDGSFVTLSSTIISQIDKDVTIVFSPDNVNREICAIPLNTAPPFAGTETGLITQAGNEALDVNKVTTTKLTLKDTTVQVSNSLSVKNSLQFLANGELYQFLIK